MIDVDKMRANKMMRKKWTVVDLFSGAGGMSYGFHACPSFEIVASVDAQIGKPSSGEGSLQCNLSYLANMGVEPLEANLHELEPSALKNYLDNALEEEGLTILSACPPCTGFSRTLNKNHSVDDPRNSLVTRTALFVAELRPAVFLMENARELIKGRFNHHYEQLAYSLNKLGYQVHGAVHLLDRFGLPQKRERALVIAVRDDLPLYTLENLWSGFKVKSAATHVRRAISDLPPVEAGKAHSTDPLHVSPGFGSNVTLRRLRATPRDGGSWADLISHPEAAELMTPAMKRYAALGDLGSHCDIYGRLWWDKPAATIKRECGHLGNGRYAHPEQNRLCTVREMSILQGFPRDYKFVSNGLTNMYRHIGDAVPPLISYQLARVCEWILTGERPSMDSIILPKTNLRVADIEEVPVVKAPEQITFFTPAAESEMCERVER